MLSLNLLTQISRYLTCKYLGSGIPEWKLIREIDRRSLNDTFRSTRVYRPLKALLDVFVLETVLDQCMPKFVNAILFLAELQSNTY